MKRVQNLTSDAMQKTRPGFWDRLKMAILMNLAIYAFLLLRATMRFKIINMEEREKAAKIGPNGSHIIALWHENAFACVSGHAGHGLVPMISLSKDGEAISRVCIKLGYQPPVRGSSSRGGSNVKKMMADKMMSGDVGAITIDGPRGPRRKPKYGAIKIASETGAPIVPNVSYFKNPWVLRSWDRSRIPKPFSRVDVYYGEPIVIPPNLDKEGIAKYADIVEEKMNELEFRVNPELNQKEIQQLEEQRQSK